MRSAALRHRNVILARSAALAASILLVLEAASARYPIDAFAAEARSRLVDGWITVAVKAQLLVNPATPGLAIDVDTDAGVVTLFGIVNSSVARDVASAAVRKVGGARQLRNALQVVADRDRRVVDAADEVTRLVIEERLTSYAGLADAEIHVAVKNGLVRLEGEARSEDDRTRARLIGITAPGASAVLDDIRVELREDRGEPSTEWHASAPGRSGGSSHA